MAKWLTQSPADSSLFLERKETWERKELKKKYNSKRPFGGSSPSPRLFPKHFYSPYSCINYVKKRDDCV